MAQYMLAVLLDIQKRFVGFCIVFYICQQCLSILLFRQIDIQDPLAVSAIRTRQKLNTLTFSTPKESDVHNNNNRHVVYSFQNDANEERREGYIMICIDRMQKKNSF